jgi:hypothetical protein
MQRCVHPGVRLNLALGLTPTFLIVLKAMVATQPGRNEAGEGMSARRSTPPLPVLGVWYLKNKHRADKAGSMYQGCLRSKGTAVDG